MVKHHTSRAPLLWQSNTFQQLRLHHGAEHFTSALYEPFIHYRCFTCKSTFGSLRAFVHYRCFTWKSTFGSLQAFVCYRCFTRRSTFGSLQAIRSLQVLHSEVHLQLSTSNSFVTGASLGSRPSAFYKKFILTGTSLGSPPSALHKPHLWLSKKDLSWKCFIRKHSTSYGLCIRHSPSGAFMALPEAFVEVENTSFDCCLLNLPNQRI